MAIEKGIQAACHELEALRVIEIHTGHAATIDRWKRMCFLINPYTTLGTLYLALNVGLVHVPPDRSTWGDCVEGCGLTA